MRILYPDDPLDQRAPDGLFLAECEAARAHGYDVSIFSFEDFARGRFDPKPRPVAGETVLYRGWMLNLDGYARLVHALTELSLRAVVSPHAYRSAHHLPSWYPLVQGYTAETLVLEESSDFVAALTERHWPGYFVKDYVKSLSTGSGSLVQTPQEILGVIAQIKKYRGEVEGGVCVRRAEEYVPGSEHRYFVAGGRAYAHAGEVPSVVAQCESLIPNPFFSVDVAQRIDGVLRIIEIGDGQVSDRKEWPAETLVRLYERIA
jgi:hypothetical protein